MSEYLLGYCLRGVPGCKIFSGIVREVRTPHIYVGEYNLRDELLRWADYPIAESRNYDHYLSPESTHDYNRHDNMPFDQLNKGL